MRSADGGAIVFVCRHRLKRLVLVPDEPTAKTILPERAFSGVAVIVPLGEELVENLQLDRLGHPRGDSGGVERRTCPPLSNRR